MENEQITKLYGGKIIIRFLGPTEDKPKRHIYMVNGERKTSVTSTVGVVDKSGALVPWALEEAAKHLFPILETGKKITEEDVVRAVFASDEVKQKAADLGTAIHQFCEDYIKAKISKGKPPAMPDDPKVATGANSFLEWEAAHKVQFLWSEKLLYSRKHDFVGKADFAAKVDGKLCLCDIKSGNSLYGSILAQTAAYRLALEEESGEKYQGRIAIRIAKETEEEYVERMALKNKIKGLLGKKEKEIIPYQIFEVRWLDQKPTDYKRDKDAFLQMLYLTRWVGKTSGIFK